MKRTALDTESIELLLICTKIFIAMVIVIKKERKIM
tara:strand:+ start:51 stop:158 length:108 start_codon:yes stop_codon:yes gene_type:complete